MRIELNNFWVEARDYITFEDIDFVESNTSGKDALFHFGDNVVIDWNLTDHKGVLLPVQGSSLLKVKYEDALFFAREWHRRMTMVDDDLKGN